MKPRRLRKPPRRQRPLCQKHPNLYRLRLRRPTHHHPSRPTRRPRPRSSSRLTRSRLRLTRPADSYQPQAAYGYPPQAPKKKKTGLIIGIGAGVLVLIIVLALVLTLGGGGKGGIAGKWTVVDTEGWSDYDEGMIFNFKGGTLTYEAPKGTPDEYKGMYELMNLLKTKYKTSGDKLTLTVSFFGQKEETVMRYEISGDTLKLYDGSDVTILKGQESSLTDSSKKHRAAVPFLLPGESLPSVQGGFPLSSRQTGRLKPPG